ncbi:RNA polymerase sigma-70 factor [Sphingobacterium chuzhouense]|uniref:RNA polymerase sigma-70 factor n=1 Tax=Sphingobacterium chuzhouense TaxID=1742264 RepID=A0ABR7XN45_9SPHI|nr:RNA polymerase sigma-70 factor [Sphingobacterium chuzhouense]MBD1420593.1 RNA polymerase sigma-70 factor [Sphingobacterium chuzhouense]
MLRKIKAGDEVAFGKVYQEYFPKLLNYIYSKTQSWFLAEEVTQITFVKLWKNRSRINEDLAIEIQLFRIAKTSLIDEIRKQNNLIAALREFSQQEVSSGVWDQIQLKEINTMLQKGIEQMPPVRKQIFTLSRIEGYSNKYIAEELSISIKTVEKHITLAIKQLRKYFLIFILIVQKLFFY